MADIKPGIYLEIKKVTIGVGSTAKNEEYRNFWMTTDLTGGKINVVLLDDDLKLTGVRNSFFLSEFQSGRFSPIPESDEIYPQLLMKFAQNQKLQSAKKPAQASPAAKSAPNTPSGPAPSQTPKPAESNKGSWWEGSQKELTAEDIFGSPGSKKNNNTPAKKAAKPEANLKKSWWDK